MTEALHFLPNGWTVQVDTGYTSDQFVRNVRTMTIVTRDVNGATIRHTAFAIGRESCRPMKVRLLG